MEFTYQEKIAIMRILLDIIHADGIIDERETLFFNKLKEEFNLEDSDYEVIKEKNSLIALSQIKLLNDEQKKEFTKLMSEMIIVDGDINTNEVAIYDIVNDFCKIGVSFENNVGEDKIKDYTKY